MASNYEAICKENRESYGTFRKPRSSRSGKRSLERASLRRSWTPAATLTIYFQSQFTQNRSSRGKAGRMATATEHTARGPSSVAMASGSLLVLR